MPSKKVLTLVALLLGLAFTQVAKADNIQTLAPYNGTGTFSDPGPYQPDTIVGTFNILSGDTSATISGTFGNSINPSSSGVNLYLGNSTTLSSDILVGSCVEFAACFNASTTPTAWSDTLSAGQLASLGTGTVDFRAVETSEFIIRLGTTTLDQVPATLSTPEPSTLLLLAVGLMGLLGMAVLHKRLA